jgi:hypothetical protein
MARTVNHDAEKLSRRVLFVLLPALFAEFEARCRSRYRSVSEVLRELILRFVETEK